MRLQKGNMCQLLLEYGCTKVICWRYNLSANFCKNFIITLTAKRLYIRFRRRHGWNLQPFKGYCKWIWLRWPQEWISDSYALSQEVKTKSQIKEKWSDTICTQQAQTIWHNSYSYKIMKCTIEDEATHCSCDCRLQIEVDCKVNLF